MLLLPKKLVLEAYENSTPRRWCVGPLQLQLGKDPWKVAVASMLLCRTRRAKAEPCMDELLREWQGPEALARADAAEIESVKRPCGLHRQRARQLVRFSSLWFSEYDDLRELPGVGLYVADAVGLFCFGCTELSCSDGVLREYAEGLCEALRT